MTTPLYSTPIPILFLLRSGIGNTLCNNYVNFYLNKLRETLFNV
uniref:Uncharacterized protein n=1 Tax=Setaria italica TaxID=4555 RepID=K3ZP70_SETIT